MKLYEVTIERKVYVLAEDGNEAEYVALDYEGELGFDDPEFIAPREVTSLSQVPPSWHDRIPYSDSDDYSSIRDFLASQEAHDVQDNEGGVINE